MARRNELGQPIGEPLPDWSPPPNPPREVMEGRYCRLEPLDIDRDADVLFAAYAADTERRGWTYLPYGPFASCSEFQDWLRRECLSGDPLFFTVIDERDGEPAGVASYLRIMPAAGSIEVGHIHFAPKLQRSPAATEAMFLMMRCAFELGYRRYEWKCDALNTPSRAAARRLGFSFEGLFRQAVIYKGRNRDTAWYAIIDADWPALRDAFESWLSPANFDSAGTQRVRLSELTSPLRRPIESDFLD
jgi:RimJ/RimL family protein N-acetyltransferase